VSGVVGVIVLDGWLKPERSEEAKDKVLKPPRSIVAVMPKDDAQLMVSVHEGADDLVIRRLLHPLVEP
jgi:hypothetical protein